MTQSADSAHVSVIIPCYNEEAGLPILLARLRAMHAHPALAAWRYLFVDDGSTDGTFATLLRAQRDDPWIVVVRHAENMGLGAALRTGFAHARSPIVCTIDSDCTYPPERLPELTAMLADGADIATASAWHPAVAAPYHGVRLFLSRSLSHIYKLMVGKDVYTFTCLFRAYRREVIERSGFRSNGFAAAAELMLRAMLSGYRIAEVPMPVERRRYGESKMKVGDAILAHMGLLSVTAKAVVSRRLRVRSLPRAPLVVERFKSEIKPAA